MPLKDALDELTGVKSMLKTAVERMEKRHYRRGRTAGMRLGIERGIEQGIDRGIEQGIEQGLLLVCKNLIKDGKRDAQIQKITGLDSSTITRMRHQVQDR